jgi:hypothetical protein
MSMRIDIVGENKVKQVFADMRKGILGTAEAEMVLAKAIATRDKVSATANNRQGIKNWRAFGKAAGGLGPVGKAVGGELAGIAAFGPWAAALTAGALVVRNLIAAEERQIEMIVAVNKAFDDFKSGLLKGESEIGGRALGRLTSMSAEDRYKLKKTNPGRYAMLLQAESIKKQTEASEDQRLGAGLAGERGKMAAARAPGSAALTAWYGEEQKKLDELRLRADKQGFLARWASQAGSYFGGDGTAESKYERGVAEFVAAAAKISEAAQRIDNATSRAAGGP